ncbi:MAG TPA: ABC transporter ATP-binding protein, partial [Candidatus Paceibacterota bacterium]|nr:ABC transporter ATP-binding protein [Candidatus Paceibacterota bacterium]HRY76903.1 ABC transporter ATP-binding protein [Candidatus Paceibacterota bacterium]
PSGSGKSTLMQILGCLDRPTGGKYFFEDKELQTYSDDELAKIRNEKIGFVFQAFNLLPRLSVLENVALPLMYRGISVKARHEKARELIHLVELDDRAGFQTSKLSGGQKQRVAIARALVNDPKIIFADEPTGNLDSKSGGAILQFLQELNDRGHTLVVVTHESYVAQAGSRTLHIIDGKINKDERVEKRRIVSKDGFLK